MKPKYSVETILQKENCDFIFFWGHTSKEGVITKTCFSQWWKCNFEIDNVSYCCAEQYMMAQKALLFGDAQAFEKIIKSKDPRKMKQIGREIVGYDDKVWNEHKYEIVLKANIAKFSQNEQLGKFLIETGENVLVEASPCDVIWGIGLKAGSKGIEDPRNWKGLNLLGFALMETRDKLKGE